MKRSPLFELGKRIIYPAIDTRWRVQRSLWRVCPVCGGPPPFREISGYGRVFLHCGRCSHLWAHDYSRLRARLGMGLTGWGREEPDTGGESEIFLARFCGETFGSRSILLYGTGPTRAFRVLHDEGLAVYGCDVSRDVIAFRQNEFGADRFFHADEAGTRRYDVVIATEVIEHFFDPIQELAKIAALCASGGVFCGSTGFSAAGEIEDEGHGYMSHRGHIIYWSERSLARAFEDFGWRLHTFRLASNVPTARLFFGSSDRDVNLALDRIARENGESPLLRWDATPSPEAVA